MRSYYRNYLFPIPCCNSEKWIGNCIQSLLVQDYPYWKAVIVLDVPTDNTEMIARKNINSDPRIKLIINTEKENGLGNVVKAIQNSVLEDEDVIVHLDGDDWLPNGQVLSFIDGIYNTKDVWITYGSCQRTHGTHLAEITQKCASPMRPNHDFRKDPWILSHLKTHKYFLWKNIKDSDLRTVGGRNEYYPRARDVAMMIPMAEMAGKKHIQYIEKRIYVYNDFNTYTCGEQAQTLYAKEIFNRVRYAQQSKEDLIREVENTYERNDGE